MINFTKLRIPAIILSLIIILLSLWFLSGIFYKADFGAFSPKGFNLSIDFQGGLVHQVTIYSGAEQEEVRKLAIESGLGNEIQAIIIQDSKKIGNESSYLIKTIVNKDDQAEINKNPDMTPAKFLNEKITKFHAMLKEKYGETYTLKGEELERANKLYKSGITGEDVSQKTETQRVLQNVVKESQNVISPVYSKGLRLQAIAMILFVLFIMLIYITFRFKFKYGVGAIAALIHDVIITLGFISFTSLEFDYTIIAAILFIIGYSLNDTIVIFDRIRENYGIMKESSSKEVINVSINQSLSRTIITSLTTLLAVVALYIWGGSKIYGFAITIIVGIISGTYSSVFIASPVVDSWEHMFASKKERIKMQKKEEKTQEKKTVENSNVTASSSKQNMTLSRKQLKKISSSKKK